MVILYGNISLLSSGSLDCWKCYTLKDNLGIKDASFGEEHDFSRTETGFGVVLSWVVGSLLLLCFIIHIFFYRYQILILFFLKRETRLGLPGLVHLVYVHYFSN